MTISETLRAKMIEITKDLLDKYEEDITTGLEDGTYKEADNVETLAYIEECKKVIAEFEQDRTAIYIYVSGGLVQGASATCKMSFDVFDNDNYEQADTEEQESMGTPDEWNEDIKERTAKNEIIGIF